MRTIEITLLFVPVLIAIAWWYGIRGLSPRGVAAAAAMLTTLALTLYWLGTDRAVSGHYTAAHVVDGRIVPGHGG